MRARFPALLLLSFASYAAGLASQILISYRFGTSIALDAYWIAFTLLNAFAFFAHPVREALVPGYYRRLHVRDHASAYLAHALGVIGGLSLGLALAMAAGAGQWTALAIDARAPTGLQGDAGALTVLLAVALPLFVLGETLNALLACYDRALLQQAVRVVGAAVNLTGLVLLDAALGVQVIALAFIAAQTTLVVVQAWALTRLGVRLRWPREREQRLDAGFYKVAAAFIAAGACSQLYALYEKNAVTGFGAGWVSALQYAVTLANVVITVFSTSVVNLLWPRLLAEGRMTDASSLRRAVLRGAELLLLGLIPVTLFTWLAAHEIVTVLFARGAFDAQSVEQTVRALRGTIFAAVPIALTALLVRALVTVGRGKPLTAIGITIAASGAVVLFVAEATGEIAWLLVHWTLGNTAGAFVASGFFLRGQRSTAQERAAVASWGAKLTLAAASAAIGWEFAAYALASGNALVRFIGGGLAFSAVFALAAVMLRLLPLKTNGRPPS